MLRLWHRRYELALLSLLALAVSHSPSLGVGGASAAETLTRIKETGTLRVGHRRDARPFSFVDDTGQPKGYVVEMCHAIAADLKAQLDIADLKIEYLEVGTEDRFQAVVDDKIDLLCGSSTATLARRESVSFSLPTFVTGISALLRADASSFLREGLAGRRPTLPPRTLVIEALRDRRFGVRAGTTAETWLGQNIERLAVEAEAVTVKDHAEGLRLVADREIDAYFADRAILLELVARSGTPSLYELGERHFTYEPYALALPRGDEDFRLAVDRAISTLYRSGKIGPLYARYFGQPGPAVRVLFLLSSLPL